MARRRLTPDRVRAPRSPRSPRPSATPPGARSTSSRTSAATSRRRHRRRGGRAVRPPPQRRPPPPRQAGRRRLRRGRHRPHAGAGAGRPSKRYRVTAPRDRASSSRSATTTCSSPCSAGRSPRLPDAEAEAMAEEVGVEYGRAMAAVDGRHRRPTGQRVVPGRAARGGRRPHRPRVRRPRRAARRRAAHRGRALPLRRRRHRAPGDLRGRPRHGAGACSARSTARPTPPPSRRLPMGDDHCVTAVTS